MDHYARAWAHVANFFRGNPGVFGYEVLNEPWPGFLWEGCFDPVLGCPLQDLKLTEFYRRVVPAIRAADPTTLVSIEGLSQAENDRVLPLLFEAGGDPSLVYQHKVMPGDIMMWDNGCTMHRRDPFDPDSRRVLHRTQIKGETRPSS